MTDYYVVEEIGDRFRVVLGIEEGPEEPYDDGQSPLLRIDYRSTPRPAAATHVMVGSRPTGDDARIEEAMRRWGLDEPVMLEKYLRAYHGARHFYWYSSQDYMYLTYDTARWREYAWPAALGYSDGPPETAKNSGVEMNEYRAWIEGEVYYSEIQQSVTYTTTDLHGPRSIYTAWVEVEDYELSTTGGYYGTEWAEERAREEFNDYLLQRDPRVCAECGADIRQGLWGDAWKHVMASMTDIDVDADEDHAAVPAGKAPQAESTVSQ